MYPETTTPAVVVHRTEAEAAKSGNYYTARPEHVAENGCRYTGKWTNPTHAAELAAAHTCNR